MYPGTCCVNVQANVLSVILLRNYRQKNERGIIRYLSVQKELETSKEKFIILSWEFLEFQQS